MKSARKATACFLAFLLLLSVWSAAFAAAPTGTEKPDAATSGGVIDAALHVPAWAIPAGFHLTAQTFTDDTGKTWYYAQTAPSKNGLVRFKWLDAAGRELPAGALPGVTVVSATAEDVADAPETWDARTLGYLTPVKNQIGGTCWAHGTIACVEANAIRQGLADPDTLDLSEYHLAWNGLNGYYEGETDGRNDGNAHDANWVISSGGAWVTSSFAFLRFSGPANESRYQLPVNGTKQQMMEAMQNTLTFSTRFDRDFQVTDVICFENHSVADIKTAVMRYGAAQISFASEAPRWARKTDANGVSRCTFYDPNPDSEDHVVTVVGWDDHFSRELFNDQAHPEIDGAWLVRNSWGSGWGENGYFWISYADKSLTSVTAYEVAPLDDWENPYFYDGYRHEGSIAGIEYAGNVFTANGHEYLTKVKSEGLQAGRNYTFSVYTDLPLNAASPDAGTLVHTQSGVVEGDGYIPLNADVELTPGQRFSVVFYKPIGLSPEGPTKGYFHYTSNPGESFVKRYGADWEDTSVMGQNNLPIRAITRTVREGPYSVTYTCPGFYSETVTADAQGCAPLPETPDGMTWALTYQGRPFDGTGVDRSITVEAHCYPTAGTAAPDAPCTRRFACVFCGKTVLPESCVHDWQWIEDEAATCGRDGKKHEECAVCQAKRNENTVIPATGNHSFTKKDANASTLIREATCTEAAAYRYTCAVCGMVEQNDSHTFPVGNPLGHSYQLTGETGATCVKQSEKVYTCANCGDVKREATPKTAHAYGDWYTETAPTCAATGTLARVCAVCGDRQTQTLNKTAHTDNDGDGYCDACRAETASHADKCPFCGQTHTGFFGAIVGFFHRIAYFFRKLFR